MAPGSQVVTDYYEKAGLWPYLEKLGFYLVGYGCTTCIGNSGPLPDEISTAINDNDLSVTAVLSGNRNFEGRISPDVKMNYLASPPLVIAYALAGTMDFDFETEPLGQDNDGNDVFLKDIWPSSQEISDDHRVARSTRRCSPTATPTSSRATSAGGTCRPRRARPSSGTRSRPTCASPRTSTACRPSRPPVTDITGARVLALLGDSVTTDHISPAGTIKAGTPAAQYLDEHGVDRKDYNSYGSRRGNHEVMIRGTFANIRLRNQLLDDVSGGYTRDFTQDGGPQAFIYDAVAELRGRRAFRWSCWAARSTAPARRVTGPPRAPPAGCARGDHRVVRAHPPVEPDRHGRHPAAVPGGRVGGDRWVWTAPRPSTSPGIEELNERQDAEDGARSPPPRPTAPRSSSTRWSASTPPVRPTTTATAASCSTCCATCCKSG